MNILHPNERTMITATLKPLEHTTSFLVMTSDPHSCVGLSDILTQLIVYVTHILNKYGLIR